ncbi:MAG: LapA family protein, partial [Candidatus Competibacter sp.]|nr:LapA family protein [Candidatus Competibacter sp.]
MRASVGPPSGLAATLWVLSGVANAESGGLRLITADPGSLPGEGQLPVWILAAALLFILVVLFWSWLLYRQAARRTRQLQQELNERRRMEVALRESEARLRDVTEAASDWIWEMDGSLRFTHLS